MIQKYFCRFYAVAAKAVDGDTTTRYSSAANSGPKEWLMIDLGQEMLVCRIRLFDTFNGIEHLNRVGNLKVNQLSTLFIEVN